MNINAHTKLSSLLKEKPEVLETIINLSPKFNKLRNSVLRRVIAPRTSILTACKIGDCTVKEFFQKMESMGFKVDHESVIDTGEEEKRNDIIPNFKEADIVILDVRPVIDSGEDPLRIIMAEVKNLRTGQILKLVNTFEPLPLIKILEKQGFEIYKECINENLVNTYFHKIESKNLAETNAQNKKEGWEEMFQLFKEKMEAVDVRLLEMPLPMHTILEALQKLPTDKALYVIHKRIPVFLLPELADQGFDYRIKEVAPGEVYMLIFKK